MFVVFVWAILLTPQAPVEAAALYIDPAISTLNRGDAITMSVRLNVDELSNECVNAVDAVITFPDNIEPTDVSIGDSIFNIWIEQPVIDKVNRTITFAGGIPNGYCGRVIGDPRLTNVLAKIIFRSPGFTIGGSKETSAKIDFAAESTAYLNDGRGTKADLLTYGATIGLSPKAGSTLVDPWRTEVATDEIPPEAFPVELIEPRLEANNRYYIVFNTTDKQTGIDHYEVMEEPLTQFGSFQWGRADAPWIEERSPYVLKDQSLNSIIRVKAIDKAGNEYISNLIPEESLRTISQDEMVLFIGGGVLSLLIFVSVVLITLTVRKRRRQILLEDEDEDDNFKK